MDAKTLGTRIRQARERLDLSQEDLAEALSRDQKAISEYENGKRRLSVVDLPILATTLQVPVSYFFEEGEELQNLDAAVLNYFHQLPSPEDRQAIIEMMRILTTIVRRNEPKTAD